MEVKEIFKFFNKYKFSILLYAIIGAILGVIIYMFAPTSYIATGSVFVGRNIQPSSQDFFTYEGYYSQQAALSYAESLMGLIRSNDIYSRVLNETNKEINAYNLLRLNKKVRVKKAGPQIITITVKENASKDAVTTWKSLTKNTIEATKTLNENVDNSLTVNLISQEPIVMKVYTSILLNTAAGILLGLFSSVTIFSFKEYLQ